MGEQQPVIVRWRDAHAENTTWVDVSDIDDEPYVVRSVGFLLEGCKTGHISIAQSLAPDEGVVDSVLHIPNDMIIAVDTVTVDHSKNANRTEQKNEDTETHGTRRRKRV